jgi:trimethylamine--corrinoid protein Co-methyltransferase
MYKPLSEKAIQDIHAASLELLGDVGFQVANAKARNVFTRHGARATDDNRVIIPPQMVEGAMGQVPEAFKLYGRRPGYPPESP